MAHKEATQRTEEDKARRAQVPTEEEAEGHIRQTDEEEDEPAIDRLGIDDCLEAFLQLIQARMVIIGIPREAAELGIEEEVQRSVSVTHHPRSGVYTARIRTGRRGIPRGRHERHRDISLKHHDRQLIAVGMGYACGIDHNTRGLHPDTGLHRGKAKQEVQ